MTTYTVSIVALQATGAALPNGSVTLQLTALDIVGGMVAPEPIQVQLDANGLGSVALLANSAGTQGTQYRVTFFDADRQFIWSGLATVPASNCNLHDVLNLAAPPALSDALAAQLAAQGYAAAAGASATAAAGSASAASGSAGTAQDAATTATGVLTDPNFIAVHGDLANIDAVGASIGSVNTAAANITAIQNAPTYAAQAQAAQASAAASEGNALSSSNAAQTASNSALAASRIYANTTAGLAGTTNGQYFYVPSAAANESLILYLNNAGSAVDTKHYPSSAALSQFLSIAPSGYAWAIEDGDGLVAVGVKNDGTFAAQAITAGTVTANSVVPTNLLVGGTDNVASNVPSGYLWALLDADYLAAVGLQSNGTFGVKSLAVTTLNGETAANVIPTYLNKGNYVTEAIGIPFYGQSLALGHSGTYIQTTTQLYDSLMFNANGSATAGPRAQEGTGTVAQNHATLIPLIEELNASSGNGETPLGNMAATIKKLIAAENGIAYTGHTYKIIASAPGQSNTTLSGLSKGQTPYQHLLDDVTYGMQLANAQGWTYSVPVIPLEQGQADYVAGTSYATYLSQLLQFYSDINGDIKAITGQSNDIKLMVLQTLVYAAYAPASTPGSVALAQLAASVSNSNIIIVGPDYYYPHATGDVHLQGTGYAWLGATAGVVFKRALIDGQAWSPVQPLSWTRQGAMALVKFSVPVLPLAFDTTTFPAVTAQGFTLTDAAGNPITINSVSLVEPDTVKIVAASTIPSGGKVRYGWNYGGNLRDSMGTRPNMDAGIYITAPLHNWCVAFEKTFV
jgi:hypothetical protein